MAETEYRPGELFVYTRDGNCEHMELGQVCRKVNDGTYACWYSTGDTAACTSVRNMRKLANAGWSHVERAGEDSFCELHYGEDDDGTDGWHCSKCGGWFPAYFADGLVKPSFCQFCGRISRNS